MGKAELGQRIDERAQRGCRWGATLLFSRTLTLSLSSPHPVVALAYIYIYRGQTQGQGNPRLCHPTLFLQHGVSVAAPGHGHGHFYEFQCLYDRNSRSLDERGVYVVKVLHWWGPGLG
jgi:hypothetical protein